MVTFSGSSGKLSFSVYRKPTHTDQYLQFNSNQPLQRKLGVVRTLYHRAQTLCSTEAAKLDEIDHIKKVLTISGYTKSAWSRVTRPRTVLSKVPRETDGKHRGYISLPYVGPVSDAVARLIRKNGVAVHMRPTNTIRSRLVHPKDKVDKKDKCGLVYLVKCLDCDAWTMWGKHRGPLRKG